MVGRLHHKNLARSAAALAGLASAVSVLIGFFAARAAPHGWLRLTVALHMSKQPLIVKLAPIVAGFAVVVAATAGVLSFYSWCRERGAEPGIKPNIESRAD